MRIALTESRAYPALRDYFLRLGADVEQADPKTIDVHFADGLLQDDESPEMYFQTWVAANRSDARITGPPAQLSAVPSEAIQPPESGTKPLLRLGELLVSKGLIDNDQLALGLVESRKTGETLGRVLVRHGSVFESELARVLAEQWSIPYVNLALVGVDRSALVLLPRDVGVRYAAVPVRWVNDELRVAFADPSDTEAVAAVQARLSVPIQSAIAELSDIDAIWRTVAA